MRMVGGVVAALVLFTTAQAEVVCVHFKKDGTLTGALKVRTACKRREVQVDPSMLGLCCDGSTTTTTSTSTTIFFTTLTTTNPTVTTTSTFPAFTTSTAPMTTTTTFPPGTTSTSVPAPTTSTSTIVTTTVTTTVTSSVTSTVSSVSTTITFVVTTSTTTIVTTTSLVCPPVTSTTLGVPGCGGSPAFCNGLCANAAECIAVGGLECSCSGPQRPCGVVTNAGACGGTCPAGQVCATTLNVGLDGCPSSYGCGCVPQ